MLLTFPAHRTDKRPVVFTEEPVILDLAPKLREKAHLDIDAYLDSPAFAAEYAMFCAFQQANEYTGPIPKELLEEPDNRYYTDEQLYIAAELDKEI